VVRSRYSDEVEVTHINGFVATSVAETIYTLTQRESTTTIERVIDDSLAAKKLKIEEFDPILDRLCLARVRGLPRLRRLVAARDAHGYKPPTSELERLLYDLLDTPEVPEVSPQLPIQYLGLRTVVDAYIAASATAVDGTVERKTSRKIGRETTQLLARVWWLFDSAIECSVTIHTVVSQHSSTLEPGAAISERVHNHGPHPNLCTRMAQLRDGI
jgi:hypothetical protein